MSALFLEPKLKLFTVVALVLSRPIEAPKPPMESQPMWGVKQGCFVPIIGVGLVAPGAIFGLGATLASEKLPTATMVPGIVLISQSLHIGSFILSCTLLFRGGGELSPGAAKASGQDMVFFESSLNTYIIAGARGSIPIFRVCK